MQILSLIGAAMVLGAYLSLQAGWMTPSGRAYNALNLIGSAVLCGVAIIDWRLGFVVLNAAWVAFTIRPLIRALRSPPPVSTPRQEKAAA